MPLDGTNKMTPTAFPTANMGAARYMSSLAGMDGGCKKNSGVQGGGAALSRTRGPQDQESRPEDQDTRAPRGQRDPEPDVQQQMSPSGSKKPATKL